MSGGVIRNAVFAGGGVRGLCYGACLQELERQRDVQLERVAGTSIGALTASLLAAGYTSMELSRLVESTTIDHLVSVNIMDLVYKWGLDRGEKLYRWIDARLQEKTGWSDTTFAQLHRHSGMELCVVATNLHMATECRMDYVSHPDLPVALAVQMSMALPPLFAPVAFDQHLFIDGGLVNNCPYQPFLDDAEHTVVFRLQWTNAFDLNTIDKYMSRVVYVGLYRLSSTSMNAAPETMRRNQIVVDGGDVCTVAMKLSPGLREHLRNKAREAVHAWVNR